MELTRLKQAEKFLGKEQQNNNISLSLEKDLAIIVDKILADTRLKKLLYYPSKDALTKPALTED